MSRHTIARFPLFIIIGALLVETGLFINDLAFWVWTAASVLSALAHHWAIREDLKKEFER